MSKPLYLYLVERTTEPGFDEYGDAVVAATQRKEAVACYVRMARLQASEELRVKLIGTALSNVEPGVVLAHFINA